VNSDTKAAPAVDAIQWLVSSLDLVQRLLLEVGGAHVWEKDARARAVPEVESETCPTLFGFSLGSDGLKKTARLHRVPFQAARGVVGVGLHLIGQQCDMLPAKPGLCGMQRVPAHSVQTTRT
jgi:hypothetical protein